MSMRSKTLATSILLPLALFAGCGTNGDRHSYIPFVYQIDVQQGNEVTQDMLAQLKPGMNKSQVRFIMGTPLVQDTFHADRWDYLYTFQKGGGDRERRLITLVFAEEMLVRVEGDVAPALGRLEVNPRNDSIVEVPKAAPTGLVGRIGAMFEDEDDGAAAITDEEVASEFAGEEVGEVEDVDGVPGIPGDLYGRTDPEERAVGDEVEAELAEGQSGVFNRLMDRFGFGEKETKSGDTDDALIYRDPTDPESMERTP